jgi:hypothetical protein
MIYTTMSIKHLPGLPVLEMPLEVCSCRTATMSSFRVIDP